MNLRDAASFGGVSSCSEEETVCKKVYHYHQGPENPLDIPGKAVRIKDGQQIMIDEISAESCLSPAHAQIFLEWGQRAYPTGKFDEGTPEGDRDVRVNEGRSSAKQKPAEDDEQHEADVDYDDKVGQPYIDHGDRKSVV